MKILVMLEMSVVPACVCAPKIKRTTLTNLMKWWWNNKRRKKTTTISQCLFSFHLLIFLPQQPPLLRFPSPSPIRFLFPPPNQQHGFIDSLQPMRIHGNRGGRIAVLLERHVHIGLADIFIPVHASHLFSLFFICRRIHCRLHLGCGLGEKGWLVVHRMGGRHYAAVDPRAPHNASPSESLRRNLRRCCCAHPLLLPIAHSATHPPFGVASTVARRRTARTTTTSAPGIVDIVVVVRPLQLLFDCASQWSPLFVRCRPKARSAPGVARSDISSGTLGARQSQCRRNI